MWYTDPIDANTSLDKLVAAFINKGGTVDKYYLQEWNKNKHALVYLKGWFSGRNVREALIKALFP